MTDVAHDSAVKHVTGAALYVDDLPLTTDQCYVAIGGSPVACGELLGLDLTAVRASEGVVDVIVAADIPGHRDIGPVFPGDPLLTDDRIEFAGQAVFAVLATSQKLARRAVAQATMDYREEAPLLSIADAEAENITVRPPHTMQRGDAAAALETSAHQISRSVSIGGQEHFYLEGQVAQAQADEDGGVLVRTSNQNPTEAQKLVAEVLGVPMHAVVVETRRMGGGFGGKETQANACCCLAALFAVRNHCSVVCRLSRVDDMTMTGKRHPFLNRYSVGFAGDGAIEAIDFELNGLCGMSADLSDAIVDRAMFHSDNAYFLPHVTIVGNRYKTNTVSNTAFRGFGGPQGMLAMEAVIDEIAFALDLDPLDVRKRNLYADHTGWLTPYHQTVSDFTVPRIIDELEETSDYRARRAAAAAFNRQHGTLKKGIALTPVKFGISFTATHLNQGGAVIHLYTDGSVHLNHGGTEMGQGLFIKVAQIVSEVLGVAVDDIKVSATRTDKVPNTAPTAASSGTDINGMAALMAASTLKERLVEHLCGVFDCSASAVQFDAAGAHVEGQPVVSWQALASSAWMARVSLSATGYYRTPEIYYDRERASGRPFLYYACGAAVSEVVIDTLTGEYKLLRVDILHDVGNSINRQVDVGQIEGGFIQGLGWLTTEELKWSSEGRLLTDSPATYKIPAIGDAPIEFNVSLLKDSPNAAQTVMRSKAVGEPPLMLALSAFSAIRQAIAACAANEQFPALNSPATPEEILGCIRAVSIAD
jgi:xanthine dehydrogenase large subunit